MLNDLSGSPTSDDFLARLEQAEAVVALDRSKLPPGWFDYGPGVNRSCDAVVAHVMLDKQFVRVEDAPVTGLPPLFVFVRRDLRSAANISQNRR